MFEWLKNLSSLSKILLFLGVFVVSIFVFDAFTGKVSEVRNWWFDRNIEKIEQKNKELEEENAKLRQDNIILKTKAEEADIKAKALDAQIEKVGGQILSVRENTEKALEEIKKEEIENSQPMDDFTRCQKLKEKLLFLQIKSAREINCDSYKN